ncbi:MAG: SDR family NAD(P)-dependent oxidoreductase, partial [Lysobacterales bacterium]
MIDLQLDEHVAIVTGASRGLGQAAALALVEQGVRVLAVARSLDELKKLETLAPGSIRAWQCDMKDA